MGNANDDLDRFLKTDGIRIIFDAKGTRTEPLVPLTIDGIDIDSIDLDELDTEALRDLLDKAEDLHDDLEDKLSDIEDFMNEIRERLDESED